MKDEDAQELILRAMAKPSARDNRLSRGQYFLIERANELAPRGDRVSPHQFFRAVWGLVAQGLAYIDFSQPDSENWTLELTDAGRRAAEDSKYIPDRVPSYLKKIAEDLPGLGATPRLYLQEALRCYVGANYIASAMMLGVASEAAFYDVAYSFCAWTPDASGERLKEILDKDTKAYIQKFVDFRARLETHKSAHPTDLQQNLDLHLNSVMELFRLVRNQVGHPTGVAVKREDAFQYLVIFPTFARRFYFLKAFFDENKRT